jgi:hypothetical protein
MDEFSDLFKKVLYSARINCQKVYICGLLLNTDKTLFPIMEEILLLCHETINFPSSKTCYHCGGNLDVIFCERKEGFHENVGDHYNVTCFACSQDWRKK